MIRYCIAEIVWRKKSLTSLKLEQNVKHFFVKPFFTSNLFSLQNYVAMLQGRSQGERGTPSTETKKNVVDNGVIFEGTILGYKFSKINIKIQFFYRIFIKNFQNFLKISQQFEFFVWKYKKFLDSFKPCFNTKSANEPKGSLISFRIIKDFQETTRPP